MSQERNSKLHVLEFPFKVLTICGCWRPESWTSIYKRIIYRAYTILIFLLINSFMLSQFMDIILIADNSDDISNNFSILIPTFTSCYKMISLLINHKMIVELIGTLTEEPCRPMGANEMKIYYKFDKNVQVNTIHYTILCTVTCICIEFTSFLTDFGQGRLMYRAWFPFKYSSTTLFCLLYAHQLVGLHLAALLNIACDVLICGLLVHVCCQFEILTYRLKRIMYPHALRNCVRQHCNIFRFAFTINTTFRMVITIQFVMSMLVVCFNLYQLTQMKLDTRYIRLTTMSCCMLTQIFIYCWYGNEVKIKSRQFIDNIFEMEWLTLDEDLKKSLILIMKRTVMPIEITSAYTISVNLDSFMGVLKTSYSAYNLLQRMD